MSTIRRLRAIEPRPSPLLPIADRPASFAFLALDKLVVDERYQRAIGKQGRSNVDRIAKGFAWRKFTPLIVTPVGSGLYAIIDGQHRATAAVTRGDIDVVPCLIVDCTPEEAAETFAAVNGAVTSVTAGQIYHARLAANDQAARELERVLAAAGARVMRYKIPSIGYARGDTLAIGTLERCLKIYGADILITALQCIIETGNGNAGELRAGPIQALCLVLSERKDWAAAGSRLLDAFDILDLGKFFHDVTLAAKQSRKPFPAVCAGRLRLHLDAALAPMSGNMPGNQPVLETA